MSSCWAIQTWPGFRDLSLQFIDILIFVSGYSWCLLYCHSSREWKVMKQLERSQSGSSRNHFVSQITREKLQSWDTMGLCSLRHPAQLREKWKTSCCGHIPEAEVSAVSPSRAIRSPLQRKALKKPLCNLPVRSDVQWSGIQHSTRPRNIKTAERRQEQERGEFWGVPVWSAEAEGLTGAHYGKRDSWLLGQVCTVLHAVI